MQGNREVECKCFPCRDRHAKRRCRKAHIPARGCDKPHKTTAKRRWTGRQAGQRLQGAGRKVAGRAAGRAQIPRHRRGRQGCAFPSASMQNKAPYPKKRIETPSKGTNCAGAHGVPRMRNRRQALQGASLGFDRVRAAGQGLRARGVQCMAYRARVGGSRVRGGG